MGKMWIAEDGRAYDSPSVAADISLRYLESLRGNLCRTINQHKRRVLPENHSVYLAARLNYRHNRSLFPYTSWLLMEKEGARLERNIRLYRKCRRRLAAVGRSIAMWEGIKAGKEAPQGVLADGGAE